MERVRSSMRSGLRIVGNAAVGVGAGSVALVSTALPESGGAVDLIAVRQPDGTLRCSPWHVRFGKYQGLLRAREKLVTITVNDELVPELTMRLGRSGVAYFVEHAPHDGAGVAEPNISEGDPPPPTELSDANGALDDSLEPDPDDSDDPGDTSDEQTIELDAEACGDEEEKQTEARDEEGAACGDVDAVSVAVASLYPGPNRAGPDAFAERVFGCDSDTAESPPREIENGSTDRRLDALVAPSGSASDGGFEERLRGASFEARGADDEQNRLARSQSCGDFLSAAGESGEMAVARRDALRRLVTETGPGLGADAVARRRPKRARRIKKRFTLRPAERDALGSRLRLGKNVVAFSFSSSLWGKQTVRAHLYLWSWRSKIVVSDVDGTITKSDVIGHLAPMVGKDWNHAGIASLYNRIRDNGFELMFLSSRAVSQSAGTRRYLEKLTQDGETLTHGPVLLAPDSISAALYREVVIRQPQVFKMGCLNAIRALFPSAAEKDGASVEECNESPFYAGFGNRETDAASYASVGVPPGRIFTINPKSEVVAETTKSTSRRWDLAEMIAMANEMFPPSAAGGGAGWADETQGDGSLIGGVSIDDAFIDSNYWGRGSMDLPEGEALP